MTDLNDLRDLAIEYVLERGDLDAFHVEFAGATSDISFSSGAPDVVAFIDVIDALLVQRQMGEITDDKFTTSVRDLISHVRVTFATSDAAPQADTTTSSSEEWVVLRSA